MGMPQPKSSKCSFPTHSMSQCNKGSGVAMTKEMIQTLEYRGDPVLVGQQLPLLVLTQAAQQKHPRSLIEAVSPQLTTTPDSQVCTLRVHVDHLP